MNAQRKLKVGLRFLAGAVLVAAWFTWCTNSDHSDKAFPFLSKAEGAWKNFQAAHNFKLFAVTSLITLFCYKGIYLCIDALIWSKPEPDAPEGN